MAKANKPNILFIMTASFNLDQVMQALMPQP
jgi:hypothetical protein